MRGAGSTARGMGAYGKGGSKPSTAPKRPLKISDNADRRLFEKKYNQMYEANGSRRTVANKSTLSRTVKSGGSGANSPSNSPRQKPAPVKPSASIGSKLSKNKGRPVTSNMIAKQGVKQGGLPKSFSRTNSPKQTTSPVKRKGK
jgi:hypothetical protein